MGIERQMRLNAAATADADYLRRNGAVFSEKRPKGWTFEGRLIGKNERMAAMALRGILNERRTNGPA